MTRAAPSKKQKHTQKNPKAF